MSHRSTTDGYDAITALEAEKRLLGLTGDVAVLDSKLLAVTVRGAGHVQTVYADRDTPIGTLIAKAGIPDNMPVKALHIGFPLGGVFDPSVMDSPLSRRLYVENGLRPGSHEIHVLFEDTCIVGYLSALAQTLRDESCGCCVFCREGLRQLQSITADIIKGNTSPEDLELIRAIGTGLSLGTRCLFGRAAGGLLLLTLDFFGGEIDAHIRRKQCPAMVCRKYVSYHILGSKCGGCGDCAEVCPKEAIEGSIGYIHVIDQYECDRCGACAEKCPQSAIVKAGTVKPRTPEAPIPVGSWRGK